MNNKIMNLKYSKSLKKEKTINKHNVGVNTSNAIKKIKIRNDKDKSSFINNEKSKSKINNDDDFNSSSSLYKNYFVGYNKNGIFIDNEKIKELRRNLKSSLNYNYKKYANIMRTNNNNINRNYNRGSLLTYNFNKDAYSNSQRFLINISNNNVVSENKDIINNKYILNLKRQKTALNNYYKYNFYPNINMKNESQKSKSIERIKKINKTALSLENHKNKYNKIFKKDINNCLSVELHKKKINKNNINLYKINRNEELLKIIDEPNCLLHYIYEKMKEYKKHKIILSKNRKKGIKLKLDNIKTDLKQIEQQALYQVINLRYERAPGNEINIKTNIFCTK